MRMALLHSAGNLLQFGVCFVVTSIVVLSETECIPRLLLKHFGHILLSLSTKVMRPNKQ